MVLRCLRTSIRLKSVICPFTGQTDFIVPVRDCSIGSKLSENQQWFSILYFRVLICAL